MAERKSDKQISPVPLFIPVSRLLNGSLQQIPRRILFGNFDRNIEDQTIVSENKLLNRRQCSHDVIPNARIRRKVIIHELTNQITESVSKSVYRPAEYKVDVRPNYYEKWARNKRSYDQESFPSMFETKPVSRNGKITPSGTRGSFQNRNRQWKRKLSTDASIIKAQTFKHTADNCSNGYQVDLQSIKSPTGKYDLCESVDLEKDMLDLLVAERGSFLSSEQDDSEIDNLLSNWNIETLEENSTISKPDTDEKETSDDTVGEGIKEVLEHNQDAFDKEVPVVETEAVVDGTFKPGADIEFQTETDHLNDEVELREAPNIVNPKRPLIPLRKARLASASTFEQASVYQGGPGTIKSRYRSLKHPGTRQNNNTFINISTFSNDLMFRKSKTRPETRKLPVQVESPHCSQPTNNGRRSCHSYSKGGNHRDTVKLAEISPRFTGPNSRVLTFEAMRLAAHLQRLNKNIEERQDKICYISQSLYKIERATLQTMC